MYGGDYPVTDVVTRSLYVHVNGTLPGDVAEMRLPLLSSRSGILHHGVRG